MSVRLENWRKEEASIDEIIERYPDVPHFAILKMDVQRRGYSLSEAAKEKLDPNIFMTRARGIFHDNEGLIPTGLILRDGTLIVGGYDIETNYGIRDPYLLDVVDGKLVLTDEGRVYEEVEFWRKPDFYDKKTSSGKPMWQVISARPQRIGIDMNTHCHFWDEPGGGCKYCTIGAVSAEQRKKHLEALANPDEVVECVKEALKQKGGFITFCVTGGSIISGEKPFDDEVNLYIKMFQKLRDIFGKEHIHLQLIGTAYSREQLIRLKEESGLQAYTSDLEVLNRELFEWICPGKAKFVGYEKWKQSLYDAVEIFGKGNVNSGIVGGVELAKPYGFKTEAEALESTLAEAEVLAEHGISVVNCVWDVGQNTIFKNQVAPSLDYYVQLAKGLNDIREKHQIDVYFDDYKRCGNHPASDLARL